VHGGVLGAFLELTALLRLIAESGTDRVPKPISFTVDYLRAAESDLELYARSDCYRLARNVAFVRAVAYERTPDDAFASCLGTFMLGANRSDSPYERLVPPEGGDPQ